MPLKDLTGKTFGRLTVVARAPDAVSASGRHRVMWSCNCECGNHVVVYGDNLNKGVTRSCGCLRTEMLSERRASHRQSNTLLYGVWHAMRNRCYRKADQYYHRYGGRGIYICDEWKDDYSEFAKWASETGYRHGLSIDRIDNDGPYSPENCRWTDRRTQANNRSSNRILTSNGESHNVTEWAKILNVDPKKLFSRIYIGWDDESVLSL